MEYHNRFLKMLGIERNARSELKDLAKSIGISKNDILYYNDNNIMPSGKDLKRILQYLNCTHLHLKLGLGIVDEEILSEISLNSKSISKILEKEENHKVQEENHKKVFETKLGTLYQGDCLSLLNSLESDSIDLVFADPPFNLNKLYPSGIDDNKAELRYIQWTENWLSECIRVLKKGGSLFLWNLPKWNTYFSTYLNNRLTFRHWIATDIKYRLPIHGRLYPSHYSLLYYCKGSRPKTFHPDRMKMETCPKCYGDLKDYGGYKSKMNPKGVSLTDIWYDIPPVRHKKYKGRKDANELSTKLIDRIIEMSTDENDLVFDPFGGAGTTYITAELKMRQWIGVEIGPIDDIICRFDRLSEEKKILEKYRKDYNALFPEELKKKRKELDLWTDDSFK